MKKKSSSTKKGAVKKAGPKSKVASTKKAAPKKSAAKKAAPKKTALQSASFRNAIVAESFRPICITENKRLDERCMSESQAFEIAQAHRRNTPTHHSVDVESC